MKTTQIPSCMNSHTHAIICIQTTVHKAYIFALGHESTHSHKADKKVHKNTQQSIFIRGLEMHMCKYLKTKRQQKAEDER